MQEDRSMDTPQIEMDSFWQWLTMHPNCILRAGTDQAVFYDLDDLHWHLGRDPEGSYSLQLIRGKLLLGEMRMLADEVAYVQPTATEEDGQTLFELFVRSSSDDEIFPGYHFLMAHGLEEDPMQPEAPSSGGHGPGGHWSH